MEIPDNIKRYLDKKSLIRIWPAKPKDQMMILQFLSDQFELNRNYSEKEVNEILNKLHSFEDSALLRRELYMKEFINREPDGSKYWKTK